MTTERLAFAVVLIVGAALIVCVALIGWLSAQQQPVPDVLQNVAIGSLTGLLGLLIKPPSRQ
jgi:VIT1/CCC1 family predicted Fe2+/Mn2+ transporter